ncbi:hypothetical protein DERP_012917 [Dermatophagoides pteronyssinus]|uniref:Uncharacterized protein n=1 Tax=Dermatophagoides pteronyssinus TaxID=6956 RepID=A0ABQ8J3N8_DERPT|nr:hypothetical protein DERP_012917 [Dermatophagoides pteronyssinus]
MIVSNKIDRSMIKLIQFRACKLIKNYVTIMISENNALFFNLNLCVKKKWCKNATGHHLNVIQQLKPLINRLID